MKIAIVTWHSIVYKELADITLPNKKYYCQRHGYDLRYVFDEERKLRGWDRIRMVFVLLPEYDAVMWMDCDAVFTNHAIPIESLLTPETNFVCATDINGLNTGTFIAVNKPITAQFLYVVMTAGPSLTRGHHWGEQEAMIRLLTGPPYENFATIVPQNAMNSYINAEQGWPATFDGNWREGDWIMHMAGIPLERKLPLAAEYGARAIL